VSDVVGFENKAESLVKSTIKTNFCTKWYLEIILGLGRSKVTGKPTLSFGYHAQTVVV